MPAGPGVGFWPMTEAAQVTPSKITILVARDGGTRELDLKELGEALKDGRSNVWIDLENTGEAGFESIKPMLEFHPMAVEDCVVDVNRPKVDDYRDYLYVAVHSARWDEADRLPVIKELDVLIGRHYLVTYHEEPTRSILHAREVLQRRPDLLSRGPDQLFYFILDVMVDNYVPIIDKIQDKIDGLAERVLHKPSRRVLADILQAKRGVAALRRIVGPQRDTILALTRDEYSGIRAELRPYFRDIYDRMARLSESLESFRDELSTLLDIYVSQVSNQLNEVMKLMTAITVVIMPATLVASIYGMNVDFPQTGTREGFWVAIGIQLAVGVGMFLYFRSRKWI